MVYERTMDLKAWPLVGGNHCNDKAQQQLAKTVVHRKRESGSWNNVVETAYSYGMP